MIGIGSVHLSAYEFEKPAHRRYKDPRLIWSSCQPMPPAMPSAWPSGYGKSGRIWALRGAQLNGRALSLFRLCR